MRDSPHRVAPPLDPHSSRYGSSPRSRGPRPFSPTNHNTTIGSTDPWKVPNSPQWGRSAASPTRSSSSPRRSLSPRVPPSPEGRTVRSGSLGTTTGETMSRGRLIEGQSSMDDAWNEKGSIPWFAHEGASSTEWFVPDAMSSMTGNAVVPVASPSRWGQRLSATDTIALESTNDPWRLKATSHDSGEQRSLYDDSNVQVPRESSLSTASIATPVLGSLTRPILAVEEGSLNRPISIHDADLLDAREKDVLQHAARKKLPDTIELVEASDMRDKDVLHQAASKRLQDRAVSNALPVIVSASPQAGNTPKIRQRGATPKLNKGILGFFRGGVSLMCLPAVKFSVLFAKNLRTSHVCFVT